MLPKEGVRDGTRCYHLNSDVQIKIDQGELLIFDGNLVHAGGDSTYPNPRIERPGIKKLYWIVSAM